MSLAEMEAYERERQIRRERVRRIVSWAPLGAAVLLLAVGGCTVWSASSGHEADRAEVAALVDGLEEEAEEAEAEFHVAWVEALERSSFMRVERVENDSERMYELLRGAVETAGGDVSAPPTTTAEDETLTPINDLADGIPELGAESQASLGVFEPVVVNIEGSTYSYFAYVDVFDADNVTEDSDEEDEQVTAVATRSVTWTTDYAGVITQSNARWADETPERS